MCYRLFLGDSDIGGLKTSIAKRYLFHDITILEESDPIPGFALIYNTRTLDSKQADRIKEVLLSSHPLEGESMEKWRSHLRHGIVAASHSDYAYIIKALISIAVPEEQ